MVAETVLMKELQGGKEHPHLAKKKRRKVTRIHPQFLGRVQRKGKMTETQKKSRYSCPRPVLAPGADEPQGGIKIRHRIKWEMDMRRYVDPEFSSPRSPLLGVRTLYGEGAFVAFAQPAMLLGEAVGGPHGDGECAGYGEGGDDDNGDDYDDEMGAAIHRSPSFPEDLDMLAEAEDFERRIQRDWVALQAGGIAAGGPDGREGATEEDDDPVGCGAVRRARGSAPSREGKAFLPADQHERSRGEGPGSAVVPYRGQANGRPLHTIHQIPALWDGGYISSVIIPWEEILGGIDDGDDDEGTNTVTMMTATTMRAGAGARTRTRRDSWPSILFTITTPRARTTGRSSRS